MNDHWIGLTNDHINFFWIRLDCIQLQKFPVDWYYGMVLKYRMFKRGPNSFFFVHIWKIYKNVFFIQFWCRYFLWIDYTESFRMSVIRFPLPLTVSIINSTETGHKCPIPKFDLGSQCRKWTIFYRKETKYCTNSDILNVWRFTQFIFWMFEDLHNLHFECLKIYTIYILNVWRFTQFIFLTRLICFFFELIVSLFFQCSKYSGSSKLLSPAYYCFQLATVCSNLLCQVKYYVHTSFFYTLVQLSLVQDFQYFSSIQIHKYYQTVLFIKIW
jgi:hypothetical protein